MSVKPSENRSDMQTVLTCTAGMVIGLGFNLLTSIERILQPNVLEFNTDIWLWTGNSVHCHQYVNLILSLNEIMIRGYTLVLPFKGVNLNSLATQIQCWLNLWFGAMSLRRHTISVPIYMSKINKYSWDTFYRQFLYPYLNKLIYNFDRTENNFLCYVNNCCL